MIYIWCLVESLLVELSVHLYLCVVYSTVPLKSRLTALTQNLLLESNAQNYQESRLKFQVSGIKMLKELFEDLDCSFKETT